MSSQSLDSLVEVSARVGQDLNLVQAGGGNTSIKQGETLWIKASGKWLVNAATDDMFLPVPIADIEERLKTGDERFPEYQARSGASLRPSVETSVHGVLPQRVVIHVHSVRTIAWASRVDGPSRVKELLDGLRWAWIPYTHPGVPLALRIQEEIDNRPDVLILENHGLVVAAEDCDAAEKLLHDVEARLDSAPRHTPEVDLDPLRKTASGSGWELPEDSEVHALAASEFSRKIASAGTLFPDQCVYLGPSAAVATKGQSWDEAAKSYQATYDFEPVFLLVADSGVVVRPNIKRAARELLLCMKRVIERIPEGAAATYLTGENVAKLMNWDAEKYRIAMARQTQ